MKRVVCFVDGFNLYHSIDDLNKPSYKWLNLRQLAEQYLSHNETLEGIYYFTAYATWNPEKQNRHKRYVKALKDEGVNVVMGKFKNKYVFCKKCQKRSKTHEEKRTDVNIALSLYSKAVKDEYDTGLIISGDGDLYPAVEIVKSNYPNKRVGIVFPINRHNSDLNQLADFDYTMREQDLLDARFPDTIHLSSGAKITCPPEWR